MGKAETGKEVGMNGMIHKPAERENVLLQAYREELVERIGRVISFDGTVQPLQGLHLYHHSVPMARVYNVVEPSLCVVAQGSKEFLLGESHYQYDPLHYLLVTVDLPNIGQVLEASKERPFLSLRLELAPTLVSSVMLETSHAEPRDHTDVRSSCAVNIASGAHRWNKRRLFCPPWPTWLAWMSALPSDYLLASLHRVGILIALDGETVAYHFDDRPGVLVNQVCHRDGVLLCVRLQRFNPSALMT